MENLAKAIICLMKEVSGMEKNSKVGYGKNSYDGTKDRDVKEIFNKAMANNGLCILPTEIDDTIEISSWEEEYNGKTKRKQSILTTVKTKYLLLHDSGESIVLAGYGHGVDSQDKGAGKATTYALKNCLLLMALTPVGKMPDAELTHSDDIVVPKKTKPVSKYSFDNDLAAIIKNQPAIKTMLSKLKLRKSTIVSLWEKHGGSLFKIDIELNDMISAMGEK